jgi:hypothetical protein
MGFGRGGGRGKNMKKRKYSRKSAGESGKLKLSVNTKWGGKRKCCMK